MTPKKIMLIGAGNIGSRHLQALSQIAEPATIFVVDPDASSLKLAKERFEQVSASGRQIKVVWSEDMAMVDHDVDVAIVATNSNVRADITEWILKNIHVQHIVLEKFLFQKISDYRRIGELIEKNHSKVWINCARRMWPFYQGLKEQFSKDDSAVHMNVSGSNLGIGCNAIHFLDLFSYISNESDLTLYDRMRTGVIKSKRNGYIEFIGTLSGLSNRGSSFSLTSYDREGTPLLIHLSNGVVRCIIDEGKGWLFISDAASGWKWREEKVNVVFQSNLTHMLVQNLFKNNVCELPEYTESSKLHLQLLELFISHIGDELSQKGISCPIT